MSWFKLNVNESLSTLKDQISNVSTAVQDAFSEGILHEENNPAADAACASDNDDSMLIGLEAANKRIDELNNLCESKDDEVS